MFERVTSGTFWKQRKGKRKGSSYYRCYIGKSVSSTAKVEKYIATADAKTKAETIKPHVLKSEVNLLTIKIETVDEDAYESA